MKRLLENVRPIALVGVATGTFVSLLWFLLQWYDEFASRFGLSDKVQGLYRLIMGIAVIQWLMMLILIWGLERVMAKRRGTEEAEQTRCSEPGGNALVDNRRSAAPGR